MLDSVAYRISEKLAKTSLSTWRFAQTHYVDHFEKVGFPVRIDSFQELAPLLDTMQENRFEKYMHELGGLTDYEYGLIVDACRQMVLFQLQFLPKRLPILPASTLLSMFCLYKKLVGIDPNFRSVLEIGPGCGYLSFFLRQHRTLENYSQIEACESFYILQNLVNLYCFGPDFEERAFVSKAPGLSDCFAVPNPGIELAPVVRVPPNRPRCTHYPWWRIGELVSHETNFQIVTSNANLLEFSEAALEDYLALIHNVLLPDGVFVVQCTGYTAHGSLQSLLDTLWNKDFALLAMIEAGVSTSPPRIRPRSDLMTELTGNASQDVAFAVNNAILVRSGHPIFGKYRDRGNYRFGFVANEPLIDRALFVRPPARRMYTMTQLAEDTEASFRPEAPDSDMKAQHFG